MRILGIEFGSWSVKAVEMESRFRRFDVLDLHEVRLPLTVVDPSAVYRKAVEGLMARLPSNPEKIVTSLLPAQTSVRALHLPVRQIKKAEQMFRYELEDSTPFRLEDTITEHQSYQTKDGCIVFAAIAPKRYIQPQIEWLKTIGAEPDWLTFDGMGLINLFLSQHPEISDNPSPTMVMDIGHQKTNICIFVDGRIAYFRSIPWGGFQITQHLSNAFNVPLEEAERLKHERLHMNAQIDNARDARDLHDTASSSMNAFIGDVNHTMYAFRTQHKKEVSAVYVCGGTASMKGFATYISEQLKRPTELFSAHIVVKSKDQSKSVDNIQFAEAHGRALVYGRKAPLLFNFRRGELAKTTSLNAVGNVFENPAFRRTIVYGILLTVALFIHASVSKIVASHDAQQSSGELRKVLQDTLKTVPAKQRTALISNPRELTKYIDQKNKELDDRLKMVGKSDPSMLALVKSISDAFQQEIKVDVNTLVIDDRSLVIEGVLYQGNLDKTTATLQQNPFFSSVGITVDGQRFTYRGGIKGR